MSKVNLSTPLFYRGDAERRPVEKELALTGVEKLFPELRFPERGMTFLYGHKSPALRYSLQEAGRLSINIAIVEVQVEIGKWLRRKIDFSADDECGLQFTRFLNVARAKKEILDELEKVAVTSLGADMASTEKWPRGSTTHPYILDQVIQHDKFSHLAVIAYSVTTAAVGDLQVATVFDLDMIETVSGGHDLGDTPVFL